MYGPDVTFAGVGRCDLDEPASLEGVDVVIIGAPYDAGASYRAGARFGPKMIRTTDYLPHDSSRQKSWKYLATSTMQSSSSMTIMPPEPIIEPTVLRES